MVGEGKGALRELVGAAVLERCLREEFGFEGSPIQISVNIREKKKRK